MGFRIYVADRFHQKDRVRDLHAKLRALGHTITMDWTVCDNSPYSGAALLRYNAENADADWQGVADCDYFVLFAQPRASQAQGAWTEFGGALAMGKQIIILGDADLIEGDPNVFTFRTCVQRVRTVDQLLAWFTAEKHARKILGLPVGDTPSEHAPLSDAHFDEHEEP